jgi:hypothetical protein
MDHLHLSSVRDFVLGRRIRRGAVAANREVFFSQGIGSIRSGVFRSFLQQFLDDPFVTRRKRQRRKALDLFPEKPFRFFFFLHMKE